MFENWFRSHKSARPSGHRGRPRSRNDYRPEAEVLETRTLLSLAPFVTATGHVNLSLDALGTNDPSGGTIRVQKPSANATVKSAYLIAATTGFSDKVLKNGDVQIDGKAVHWTTTLANDISSFNGVAKVTSFVKSKINAAPAGTIDFHITEGNARHKITTNQIDGEILAVVFNDPAQKTINTVALLFGAQNVAGDTFSLNLAKPIDKTDPNLLLDMSLGIGFGFQGVGNNTQHSNVTVNGQTLSQEAGGQDDGQDQNGALITVGGIGDTDANPPPTETTAPLGDRSDDELYDLRPFVNNGDKTISVNTINPSDDDNIMFAAFNLHSVKASVIGSSGGVAKQIKVYGSLDYNFDPSTGVFSSSLQIFNRGNTTLTGPISVTFHLPQGATLLNATNNTITINTDLKPGKYLTVPFKMHVSPSAWTSLGSFYHSFKVTVRSGSSSSTTTTESVDLPPPLDGSVPGL